MGSSAIWSAISWGGRNRSGMSGKSGSLPILYLRAISQELAAEKNTSFPKSFNTAAARAPNLSGSKCDHNQQCVSRRIFIYRTPSRPIQARDHQSLRAPSFDRLLDPEPS